LGPEAKIQQEIILALRAAEWFVMVMHGNEFQKGVPDLYACHAQYGPRWIEVKNPLAYAFTPAQREMFPKFTAVNSGIWVLTSATPQELGKLFQPSNWWQYLK
jgi:hypothetical protein